MDTTWKVWGVVALTILWPTVGFGQTVGPVDGNGQSTGRPEMRDPYGFDKDRDREETGNQGRPLDDSQRGRGSLEAPSQLDVSWSIGRPSDALQVESSLLDCHIAWTYLRSTEHQKTVDGFRVYARFPGENALRLFRIVPLNVPVKMGFVADNGMAFSWLRYDELTKMPIGHIWDVGYGKFVDVVALNQRMSPAFASLIHRRNNPLLWPVGEYQFSVVAYDRKGREGSPSPIGTTQVIETALLKPQDGEVVTTLRPVFELPDLTRDLGSGFYYYSLGLRNPTTHWKWETTIASTDARLITPRGRIGVKTFVYPGPLLSPGQTYLMGITVYGWRAVQGQKAQGHATSALPPITTQSVCSRMPHMVRVTIAPNAKEQVTTTTPSRPSGSPSTAGTSSGRSAVSTPPSSSKEKEEVKRTPVERERTPTQAHASSQNNSRGARR